VGCHSLNGVPPLLTHTAPGATLHSPEEKQHAALEVSLDDWALQGLGEQEVPISLGSPPFMLQSFCGRSLHSPSLAQHAAESVPDELPEQGLGVQEVPFPLNSPPFMPHESPKLSAHAPAEKQHAPVETGLLDEPVSPLLHPEHNQLPLESEQLSQYQPPTCANNDG